MLSDQPTNQNASPDQGNAEQCLIIRFRKDKAVIQYFTLTNRLKTEI